MLNLHGIKKTVINLTLLCLSVVFSLIIIEAFLRYVSPLNKFHPFLDLVPNNRLELHVNLRGLSPVAIHSTNSLGFRGDEPPVKKEGGYKILAIGGSTTQCFYLDDKKTWPHLLQKKLRVENRKLWVGNGGLDGHSTRGHLLFMKTVVPKIKPDATILMVGVNDLSLSISKDRRVYKNGVYKPTWRYRLLAHSRLVQVLLRWKLIIFDKAYVVKRSRHESYEPLPLKGKEMPLPKDLKKILPLLDEFRDNIREIMRLGRLAGTRLVFVTQPMLFDDREYWKTIEGEFYWVREKRGTLSAASYWRLLDIYNKELIELCREEGVDCFDLASIVPHSEKYFYDPVHFTEKGAELVSEKIAEFFIEADLIGKGDNLVGKKVMVY